MKKYIFLLLLIPFLLGADEVKTVNGVSDASVKNVIGVTGSTVKSCNGKDYNDGDVVACNSSTDYVGSTGDYSAGNFDLVTQTLYCVSFQAVSVAGCLSGTLAKPYLAHNGVAEDSAKIFIYTDSTGGTAAPNGETLIAASAAITCSTDTATPTCTNDTELGGAVTIGSYYFLCIVATTSNFDIHRITTGPTQWYKSIAGSYATPPDPLAAGGWTDGGTRTRGAYVAIK